jgi:NAD-dependent SIR2 family protein deacetylase
VTGRASLCIKRMRGASPWQVRTLMTQNVDRLHQTAGSTDVLEMHGTTHEVR